GGFVRATGSPVLMLGRFIEMHAPARPSREARCRRPYSSCWLPEPPTKWTIALNAETDGSRRRGLGRVSSPTSACHWPVGRASLRSVCAGWPLAPPDRRGSRQSPLFLLEVVESHPKPVGPGVCLDGKGNEGSLLFLADVNEGH